MVALRHKPKRFLGDRLRFLLFVVGLRHHQLGTTGTIGPEPLVRAIGVCLDDVVGGVEDHLG